MGYQNMHIFDPVHDLFFLLLTFHCCCYFPFECCVRDSTHTFVYPSIQLTFCIFDQKPENNWTQNGIEMKKSQQNSLRHAPNMCWCVSVCLGVYNLLPQCGYLLTQYSLL